MKCDRMSLFWDKLARKSCLRALAWNLLFEW